MPENKKKNVDGSKRRKVSLPGLLYTKAADSKARKEMKSTVPAKPKKCVPVRSKKSESGISSPIKATPSKATPPKSAPEKAPAKKVKSTKPIAPKKANLPPKASSKKTQPAKAEQKKKPVPAKKPTEKKPIAKKEQPVKTEQKKKPAPDKKPTEKKPVDKKEQPVKAEQKKKSAPAKKPTEEKPVADQTPSKTTLPPVDPTLDFDDDFEEIPEEPPLTPEEIEKYRRLLQKDDGRLIWKSRSLQDQSLVRFDDDRREELGGDDIARTTELRKASMSEDSSKQIQISLRKMEEGTYGKCQCCGKQIPRGRLDAHPQALYCIFCQESIEEEEKRTNFTNRNNE